MHWVRLDSHAVFKKKEVPVRYVWLPCARVEMGVGVWGVVVFGGVRWVGLEWVRGVGWSG